MYNRGDRTVKFVTIKVLFKNKNDNVIDTDSTYAVGSEVGSQLSGEHLLKEIIV